jgi:two-component system NtrC family sensor kinase
MATLRDFRTFSLRILRAAHHARPMQELVRDYCSALVGVVHCEAIELWLIEGARISRWRFDAGCIEATRCANVAPEAFRELRAACCSPVTSRPLGQVPPASVYTKPGEEGRPPGEVVCWPLTIGDDPIGYVFVCGAEEGVLGSLDARLVIGVTETLAVALEHNRVHLAQRERVKELSCLYQLATLASRPYAELEELLQQVVSLLPPSWQYPEHTVAQLELDGRCWETRPYDPSWQSQGADIVIADEVRGAVRIAYAVPMPTLDEGPFLEEERRLLDTVATEVATMVARKTAQRDLLHLQAQLQHSDRLATIGHLAAGVAHELNEPLGAILGFAQLARKHPQISPEVEQDVRKIEAAALHAREVTARLMLVGRKNTAHRERLDLNAVIRDTLSFLGARMAQQRIHLECALAPDLPGVMGERAQLQQVVINLAVNAIQAMNAGGVLRIRTAYSDGALELTLQDTGEGMSELVMARIFEPFFTTKQANEGTGLGLPVVREIIDSLGGDIQVESTPGEGATFRVTLPIAPRSSENRGG